MSEGEDRPDVIVVGGGLAGLACALVLARGGRQVLVLERGDPCGAKNLSGGRLYLGPLGPLAAELLEGAPFERPVRRETLTLLAEGASTSMSFESARLAGDELRSFTVLRARLDGWLADKVTEAGGMVVTGARADGLLVKDGRVRGAIVDGEELEAEAVVAADGALAGMARGAGLRGPLEPSQLVLGVKGLYAMDPGRIEDRFGLDPGEGAAELLVGEVTSGVPGGAFLYTNRDTVSLGVVVRLDGLREAREVQASELLARLEARPEVARRLAGAELREYGAHLIPEVEPSAAGRLVGDGVLVVGDAAALVINHGITVRGMDLALGSGALAGRALLEALEAGDTSRAGLARYESALRASLFGADVLRFKGAPKVLSSPWLFRELPALASELAEDLYSFTARPKERLSRTTFRHLRRRLLGARALSELYRLRRL